MLKKIWRRLVQLFQRLMGWFKPKTPVPTKTLQPLTDTDYEMQFMSLLDAVSQSRSDTEILRRLDVLKQHSSEAEWVAWLQRFRTKLLASAEPNRVVGQQLIKFSEISGGELGQAARELGQQLLIEEPQDAEGWFNRGVEQLDRGEDEAAVASFDRAIALDPSHHRAWINRGNGLANLGQLEAAITSYDQALAMQPGAALAWGNRGDTLYDLGRYEAAILSWEKSLEIEPNDAEIWYNKGLALGRELGRWEEAIASWNKALELQPNDTQTWLNRGIGFGALEQWEAALESWQKAAEINPNFRDAWINIGMALQKLGRYGEAIEANNKAIACDEIN